MLSLGFYWRLPIIIDVENPKRKIIIEKAESNLDKLNEIKSYKQFLIVQFADDFEY